MVWNSPTSLHACECVRVYARLAGISSTGVVRLKSVIEPKWHFHKKINKLSYYMWAHTHTQAHASANCLLLFFIYLQFTHTIYTHTSYRYVCTICILNIPTQFTQRALRRTTTTRQQYSTNCSCS